MVWRKTQAKGNEGILENTDPEHLLALPPILKREYQASWLANELGSVQNWSEVMLKPSKKAACLKEVRGVVPFLSRFIWRTTTRRRKDVTRAAIYMLSGVGWK